MPQHVNIEKIIRPYQTPDVSPARVRPPTTTDTAPVEPVTYECGKGGSVKSIGTSFSLTTSYYMDQKVKEQKKKT